MLSDEQIKKLEIMANIIRQDIIICFWKPNPATRPGPLEWPMSLRFCITRRPLNTTRKIRIGKKETGLFFPMGILPGALRHDGESRIFSARRIENFAKVWLKIAGTSAQVDVARAGNIFRSRLRFVASGEEWLTLFVWIKKRIRPFV